MNRTELFKWALFISGVGYIFYVRRAAAMQGYHDPTKDYTLAIDPSLALDLITTPVYLRNPYFGVMVRHGAEKLVRNYANRYGIETRRLS